jgi:hypothetical protein
MIGMVARFQVVLAKQTDRHTDRQTDRQTDSQIDRPTSKHTVRQTDRQKYRQANKHRQTDRQINRQIVNLMEPLNLRGVQSTTGDVTCSIAALFRRVPRTQARGR